MTIRTLQRMNVLNLFGVVIAATINAAEGSWVWVLFYCTLATFVVRQILTAPGEP